jgi:hypothetical protein
MTNSLIVERGRRRDTVSDTVWHVVWQGAGGGIRGLKMNFFENFQNTRKVTNLGGNPRRKKGKKIMKKKNKKISKKT